MNQNKKKAKFTFLDAIFILFITALIGAVVYGLFGGFPHNEQRGDTAVAFEVKISNVKESAVPFIAEGLRVRDSVTGEEIGTVSSVRAEKSCYYGGVRADENGTYTLGITEYPDEYDVYVTVSATARSDDRGIFSVGDIRMLIGETVYFQVKSFSSVSYIVNTEFYG